MAGRERRRGECQNVLGFCFGAKVALNLATVRAAAKRRPPKRSGVGKDAEPTALEDEELTIRNKMLEGEEMPVSWKKPYLNG